MEKTCENLWQKVIKTDSQYNDQINNIFLQFPKAYSFGLRPA